MVRKLQKIKGFSIIELIVALTIFSISFTAVFIFFFGNKPTLIDTGFAQSAMDIARNGITCARIIRDTSSQTLNNGTYGFTLSATQCQLTEPSPLANGITGKIEITTDSEGNKLIKSIAEWNNESDTKNVNLLVTLTPLYEGISGDWKKPIILGSYNIPGSKGTDIEYSGGYVFVTNSSPTLSTPDIYVFNVSNPAIPTLAGQLNIEEGLKAIAISGNYAYVVEENSSDFFVIDISTPSSPVKKAKLTLNGGSGMSIDVDDSYAYITTKSSFGPELFIIDISNPLIPSMSGFYEIGSDANKIDVASGIAYIATSADISELKIVDVSIPSSPFLLSNLDLSNKGDGLSVHAKTPSKIYIGRTKKDSNDDLVIVNAYTPQTPLIIGGKNVESDVSDIKILFRYAFLATSRSNHEFQIYDISNPSSIKEEGKLGLPDPATGLAYSNNKFYISTSGNTLLEIVTSEQ